MLGAAAAILCVGLTLWAAGLALFDSLLKSVRDDSPDAWNAIGRPAGYFWNSGGDGFPTGWIKRDLLLVALVTSLGCCRAADLRSAVSDARLRQTVVVLRLNVVCMLLFAVLVLLSR